MGEEALREERRSTEERAKMIKRRVRRRCEAMRSVAEVRRK